MCSPNWNPKLNASSSPTIRLTPASTCDFLTCSEPPKSAKNNREERFTPVQAHVWVKEYGWVSDREGVSDRESVSERGDVSDKGDGVGEGMSEIGEMWKEIEDVSRYQSIKGV